MGDHTDASHCGGGGSATLKGSAMKTRVGGWKSGIIAWLGNAQLRSVASSAASREVFMVQLHSALRCEQIVTAREGMIAGVAAARDDLASIVNQIRRTQVYERRQR